MSQNGKQHVAVETVQLEPTPASNASQGVTPTNELNMSPPIDGRKSKVDGFPFPYQPTPPISKHVSLAPVDTIPGNDYPFLTNVGELNGASIVRGGFGAKKVNYDHASSQFKVYPPLPNTAYLLTSQAHVPKDATNFGFKVYMPTLTEDGSDTDGEDGITIKLLRNPNVTSPSGGENLDGAVHDKDEVNHTTAATATANEETKDHRSINDMVYLPPKRQPLTLHTRRIAEPSEPAELFLRSNSRNTKTKGERLADNLKFTRKDRFQEIDNPPPGVSGSLYPSDEERADFIEHIDKHNPELEYCRKCKTKHITPGPPMTLQDRDTCGAYLPEWFPAGNFERPWEKFQKIMNDLVLFDEINQGFSHKPNPDQPYWDLQFHEYSSRWKELGKRGGWWKCRDGEDATDAELNCDICRTETARQHRASHDAHKGKSVADRLASLHEFINYHVKVAGEKDKAIVLAQIRAEGYPQYLGPRTIEEERFRTPSLGTPSLGRVTSTATMNSYFSIETKHTAVGLGSPIMGRSPLKRERG